MKLKNKNNKSVMMLVGEIARTSHIYFRAKCKNHRIGHAQMKTLVFIAKNKNVSQREIVKFFGLDKSSVTSQLNLLEKNRYVEKTVSKSDARVHQISVTKKAKQILKPLKEAKKNLAKVLFQDFNEREMVQMISYLERMQKNIKNDLN